MAFVLGLFTSLFAGIPWHVMVADDPIVPWWLRLAVFCLLGGILVVLVTLALEQRMHKTSFDKSQLSTADRPILLLNYDWVHGKEINEVLGLVQGHTVAVHRYSYGKVGY